VTHGVSPEKIALISSSRASASFAMELFNQLR
jgi:hypothetical protein